MELKILARDKLINKVCVIVGTRPSLIKLSPIIRGLDKKCLPYFIIHTGQHYSYELDQAFFLDLEIPEPDFRLKGIKDCKFHGHQTAEMLKLIEEILVQERPNTVLVGGDANSNLAGALAARKLNLVLAHDESGLRSFKWNVPEEHNRVIMDHISDYLFCPNEQAKNQLENESVCGQIYVTGSTTVDAVNQNIDIANQKSKILDKLSLDIKKYIVITAHHEENVDYEKELGNIVKGLIRISKATNLSIVFPIHPRTRHRLEYFNLENQLFNENAVFPIKPIGYFDMLVLANNASLVITDSGGLIQESAIMNIPCMTLGHYTEWRECVEVGANKVSMNEPVNMETIACEFIKNSNKWENPFGEPGAAEYIVSLLKESFSYETVL